MHPTYPTKCVYVEPKKWTSVSPWHEAHSALQRLPRRRRPHRNPFIRVIVGGAHTMPEPRQIRRLLILPPPPPPPPPLSPARPKMPTPSTLLVGSIGSHGEDPADIARHVIQRVT
jgi:hypothetical protein